MKKAAYESLGFTLCFVVSSLWCIYFAFDTKPAGGVSSGRTGMSGRYPSIQHQQTGHGALRI